MNFNDSQLNKLLKQNILFMYIYVLCFYYYVAEGTTTSYSIQCTIHSCSQSGWCMAKQPHIYVYIAAFCIWSSVHFDTIIFSTHAYHNLSISFQPRRVNVPETKFNVNEVKLCMCKVQGKHIKQTTKIYSEQEQKILVY